jgi:site-specific DNA recombinase
VIHRIRAALSDDATVLEAIHPHADEAPVQKRLLAAASTL